MLTGIIPVAVSARRIPHNSIIRDNAMMRLHSHNRILSSSILHSSSFLVDSSFGGSCPSLKFSSMNLLYSFWKARYTN